jgi:dienelactone hydrolase
MNFSIPIVSGLLSLTLSSVSFAQSFQIAPKGPIVVGDPVSISLTGLSPNVDVTITSERAVKDGSKRLIYKANATYKVDAAGNVDFAKAEAKNGTFKGVDLRGLFWSAVPTKTEASEQTKDGVTKLTATVNGKDITTTEIKLLRHRNDLVIEELDKTNEKFPGAIVARLPDDKAQEKRAAMIVLSGSDGGNSGANALSLQFASMGYVVMSFPYYSPPDWQTKKQEVPALPKTFTDISINRINDARDYLRTRKDVDGDRIAIYGVSKGAEFVLIAASNFSWPKAVIAVVPTDIVWEGWGENIAPNTKSSFSLNGKALPFTPYKDFEQEFMGYQTGEDVRIRRPQDKGRAANPIAAAAARIPIEKYKGPLLIIAGQEDQMWNSGMMAHNIAERRAEAKLETVSLIYTDAGHALTSAGWSPTTQYDVGPLKTGGTPAGNARAQADAWEKTVAFLKKHLAK